MDGRLIPIFIAACVAVIVVFWIVRVVTGIIKTKKFYEMKMQELNNKEDSSLNEDNEGKEPSEVPDAYDSLEKKEEVKTDDKD